MDSAVRPFIIISTGRSGSSYTAKQFADAGIWCGRCRPGDAHNPQGYYENMEIKRRMKRRFGWDWAYGAFPEGNEDWAREVRSIMADQGYGGGPWFFKCGAFYWKCFEPFNPVYVKVWRSRDKILASYKRLEWLARRFDDDEVALIVDRQHEAMREIDGMDIHI